MESETTSAASTTLCWFSERVKIARSTVLMPSTVQHHRGTTLAYLGIGLGMVGWVIGLAVLCLVAGDYDNLLWVGLPCLLISLALWASMILATEGVRTRFGLHRKEWGLTLAGILLSDVALLGFLVNYWVIPVLVQNPDALDTLRKTGSSIAMPASMLWGCLLGGCGCLVQPTIAVLRTATKPEDG